MHSFLLVILPAIVKSHIQQIFRWMLRSFVCALSPEVCRTGPELHGAYHWQYNVPVIAHYGTVSSDEVEWTKVVVPWQFWFVNISESSRAFFAIHCLLLLSVFRTVRGVGYRWLARQNPPALVFRQEYFCFCACFQKRWMDRAVTLHLISRAFCAPPQKRTNKTCTYVPRINRCAPKCVVSVLGGNWLILID